VAEPGRPQIKTEIREELFKHIGCYEDCYVSFIVPYLYMFRINNLQVNYFNFFIRHKSIDAFYYAGMEISQ
jgi:hypothetical protein